MTRYLTCNILIRKHKTSRDRMVWDMLRKDSVLALGCNACELHDARELYTPGTGHLTMKYRIPKSNLWITSEGKNGDLHLPT